MDTGHPGDHPRALAMITADDLIDEARRLTGTPYLHQGRSGQGVDCIGLVLCVCEALGTLPREFERRNYARLPQAELVLRTAHHCTPAPCPPREPGLMLLIRWPGAEYASHTAIFAGQTLIHCYAQAGRVVEHGYRGHWPARTESAWRLPGIAYGAA